MRKMEFMKIILDTTRSFGNLHKIRILSLK